MSIHGYILPLAIWMGTLVICCLCTFVAWRALFGDRGLGRRRCPRCWYDMAYSPGMTCAECGHTARKESEFARTRRRPFLAMAAIVVCVIVVIGVNEQMNPRGVMRHAPTGLLIWALPVVGGMDGEVGRELDRRATQRQLTQAHWERLIARCAAGDWLCSPPSTSWSDNYGDFVLNWRSRFIGDATVETPLMAIPPRLEATSRDTWPTQTPLVVAVRLEDWWPAGMECRVRASPRVVRSSTSDGQAWSEAEEMVFYRGGEMRFRPSPFAMYLPPLPEGEHEVEIVFTVDRRRMEGMLPAQPSSEDAADSDADPEDSWEPVGTFATSFTTRIEGTLDELAKPIQDDSTRTAMSDAMAQVFGNAVRWQGGGRSPVRFGINAQATFFPHFNDIAVGVSVELLHEDTVARRLNLWWLAGDNVADGERNYGFEINFEDLALLRQLDDASIQNGAWSLRVRSDPAIVLRAGPAKHYWQGDFTTPINLRTSRTQAPPRMWWTENDAEDSPDDEAPTSRRGGRRSL